MIIGGFVIIFIINNSSELIAGQEAPHTIAEGLNIFYHLYYDFSSLNDSGISFSHHFYLCYLCALSNNNFIKCYLLVVVG